MTASSIWTEIAHPTLLVIGDLILDRYVSGACHRISPEAPVIVLKAEEQEVRLGGAANVSNMLRGLEANVILAGVIGDDADGRVVQHLVQEVGIDSALLVIDKLRRTSVKERFLSLAPNQHPHQLLRVDYESNHPIEGLLGAQLTEHILENLPICDALLISDYGKGVCTSTLLRQVILEARRRKIPVIVDPATVPDLSHYHGATILTPNRKEASFAARFSVETPEQAIKAGRVLCRELGLDAVLVTLDRDGIVLVVDNGQAEHFPRRSAA
jgi:D-beta-D-heptose 7-phosphate kinase/D-beta-D-heptose 1-phosphate adenosyltransferase